MRSAAQHDTAYSAKERYVESLSVTKVVAACFERQVSTRSEHNINRKQKQTLRTREACQCQTGDQSTSNELFLSQQSMCRYRLMSPLAPPRAPVSGEQWRSVGDVRLNVPRTNAAVHLCSGECSTPPFPLCVCSRTKLCVWIGVRAGVKFTLHSLTTLKYLDMQNTSRERPQHSRKKNNLHRCLLFIYQSKSSWRCVCMCFMCVCYPLCLPL